MARLVLCDVSEAAEIAEVTRRTVYKWIEAGLESGDDEREYLTAYRLGGLYYIDPDDLEDFLNFREDLYSEEE